MLISVYRMIQRAERKSPSGTPAKTDTAWWDVVNQPACLSDS